MISSSIPGLAWPPPSTSGYDLPSGIAPVSSAVASKTVTIDFVRVNAARRPGVTVVASSFYSDDYRPELAIDGITRQWAVGEWASRGEQDPWIELTFPHPIRSDRVVLFDRSISEDANNGTLTFSDGSSVEVTGIPPDGAPKTVEFPERVFDQVRFQVVGGSGPNVGLSEIEVYAMDEEARP